MSESLRILLLEGSDDDARKVMDAVRAGGLKAEFDHRQEGAGVEALLSQQQWDLILCNFQLSDYSALDLLKQVRRRKLDLPVIVLSDGIGEELAITVMHAGAHDFITKQNLSRLVPAIERELEELAIHRENKQAQTALRESEQRFRQLTENIGEVFWLFDTASGELIYLSPAFEDVWEQAREPVMAEPERLLDTVHPEDFHRVQKVLEQHGWKGFNVQYRIVLPSGEIRWIDTKSFPIADGGHARVAGLSVDYSDRMHLTEDREMLSRALEQSADAVTITDANSRIVYVNRAFEEVSGYDREEVIGLDPNFLKSGFQDDKFYDMVWANLNSGLPFTDIFINRRKDGELYYEAKTITPVRGSGGEITHFVSTGKDITDRLKTRERLHKLVHYDAVTGLANSSLLQERLEQALHQVRQLDLSIGVMYIGLELTELLGEMTHKKSTEKLLYEVGQQLSAPMGPAVTIARMGTDEFVVLLKGVKGRDDVEQQAKALVSAFNEPVKSIGYELFLTPSIGISLSPGDGEDGDTLIEHARSAMKHAREEGHGLYAFYRQEYSAPQRHLSS